MWIIEFFFQEPIDWVIFAMCLPVVLWPILIHKV